MLIPHNLYSGAKHLPLISQKASSLSLFFLLVPLSSQLDKYDQGNSNFLGIDVNGRTLGFVDVSYRHNLNRKVFSVVVHGFKQSKAQQALAQ